MVPKDWKIHVAREDFINGRKETERKRTDISNPPACYHLKDEKTAFIKDRPATWPHHSAWTLDLGAMPVLCPTMKPWQDQDSRPISALRTPSQILCLPSFTFISFPSSLSSPVFTLHPKFSFLTNVLFSRLIYSNNFSSSSEVLMSQRSRGPFPFF